MQMKHTRTYNYPPPPPPAKLRAGGANMRTSRRIPALFALSILIAFAALLSLSDTTAAQSNVDYDTDDDNLIEISTHAQLNAIRHDLNGNGDATHADYVAAFPNRVTTSSGRMGCPSGTCRGYELTANISLDDGDNTPDSGDPYWNGGAGWLPIGDFNISYSGAFKGNGYTIDRLFINRNTTNTPGGLFGSISTNSRIESLGMTNANVTLTQYNGILVGHNQGTIIACYTTGSITGTNRVGGISGYSTKVISSSYSTASVTGTDNVGGLLGQGGNARNGFVRYSYSTGAVSRSSGTATNIGGLIGETLGNFGGVTASYYDTTTSGCVSGGSNGCTGSAGGAGAVGKTTSELQSVTGYTGIYAAWNANIDGVTGGDDPWDFAGSSAYPALIYHLTDYDRDEDNYIEVSTLAQLDAIRHDLNGNGDPTSAGATAYGVAFPNRITSTTKRMGCPGTCTGYELTASLDFDSDGDGDVDASDHGGAYHNSGSGWNPIATYTSNFKGNGHTINNLYINRTSGSVGLFGRTNWASIETLGVTNANVRGGANTGILIGYMSRGAMVACYTSGKVRGGDQTGGLVGYSGFNGGAINTSYSTAYVRGGQYVGGVVGFGSNGSITNSYSTGRVDGSSNVGGLLGCSCASHTQSASYWDTSASGRSNGIGRVAPGALPGSSAGVTGKTTRELQIVTTYTGIYSAWNNNLDGVTGNDDPWDLGNKMQYPMLDYKSMSTDPQGGQAMGVPDNWNAPIVGELVGVCLNAATFPRRSGAWIWERSDNGDTWETIGGWRQPTYEYTPTTSDVNHYLRAKVQLSDNSFAYTRALGGRVKNASGAAAGTAIAFVSGNASPRVGTEILVSDPRPSGAVDSHIAWQRCPNATAPHTDCIYIRVPHTRELRYTPTSDDLNMYLRIYVYYATSAGVWTRHVSGYTGQVAAASQ